MRFLQIRLFYKCSFKNNIKAKFQNYGNKDSFNRVINPTLNTSLIQSSLIQ